MGGASRLMAKPMGSRSGCCPGCADGYMLSCSCGLWLINYMEYWTGTALSDHVTQVIL